MNLRRFLLSPLIAGVLIVSIGTTVSAGGSTAHKVPTLGIAGPWKQALGVGFGKVRPSEVYTGGEAIFDVRNLHWKKWGGRHAVAHGKALWPRKHGPVSNYPTLRVKAVAYHLGKCHGRPAYQRFEWYFPSKGGHFDPRHGVYTCNPTR